MIENSVSIIKKAVSEIVGRDVSGFLETDPLELDSIHRITLIVELENIFDVIISDENLVPEVFDTIGSLATFVKGLSGSDEV